MQLDWLKVLLLMGVFVLVLLGTWIAFAEKDPELEREIRTATQEQLEQWFPEAMALPPELVGFQRGDSESSNPHVVLIHGLDEPGGIWDETLAAFADEGIEAWEFRYPNDQAIDRSADLLAQYWSSLEGEEPIILIGHSMGGLVIRDFITRWRYPSDGKAKIGGPEVLGVIQVGPPNQGSAWARFRAWLEVREWLSHIPEGQLSPFIGFRQGTGAAKIDLRPGSQFLTDLNSRTWPEEVKIQIIGGKLSEPTYSMLENIDQIARDLDIKDARERMETWWAEIGDDLGDGVVPLSSLPFNGAPEPMLFPASHRGLLITMPLVDTPPPAISPMIDTVKSWRRSLR
jgi:pimeloyl-ACP methyl ester carboxylesterase